MRAEAKLRSLPEAALDALIRIEEFRRQGLQDLQALAETGKLTSTDVIALGEALSELRETIEAAYGIEYAREERWRRS